MQNGFLCFFIIFIIYTEAHKCLHDQLVRTVLTESVDIYEDETKRFIERDYIRIFVNSDKVVRDGYPDSGYTCYSVGQTVSTVGGRLYCGTNNLLTAAKSNYIINDLLPAAIAKFEQTLKGNLKLPAGLNNCFPSGIPLAVPATYRSTGVPDSDVIIFVSARPVGIPNVSAFGGECATDSSTKRSIAGFLNIDPTSLSLDEKDREQAILIILHEMTHLFGFTYDKLKDFVSVSDGVTPVPLSNVLLTEQLDNGRKLTKIKTPKVLAAAREHFGCESLNGLELEDGGGNATALSHWEERILYNEYMTGSVSELELATFSPITLALLEDSGWYEVDYSTATPATWGYKRGCSFLEVDKCKSWPKMYGGCTSDSQTSCNFDRQSKAFCGFATDLNITEPYYMYYNSTKLGGFDQLSDYCPYYVAYTNGVCSDVSNALDDSGIRGELFESHSKCFDSSIYRNEEISDSYMSCYGTRCISDAQIKIAVNYNYDDFSALFALASLPVTRVWYDCPYGESISVFGYTGKIVCPSVNEPVCLGGNDPEWPLITSVTPSSGDTGAVITIEGTNFNSQTMVVYIGDTNSDCAIVSNTTITCTLGSTNNFQGENIPIFIADPATDKSSIAPYESFQYAAASQLVSSLSLIMSILYIIFNLL